jgi:EAL domain-containing protein (putative c-di-GMP-specific phosphodiesterase class I)
MALAHRDGRGTSAPGDFELPYQRQVSLANNELASMEALLRWRNAK